MRKLSAFNQVSLDGYFADANDDMMFVNQVEPDPAFDAWVADNAKGGGVLVFGRITYDHMAAFWPTSFAAENFPVVAERMNNMPKIVFSRTMKAASWKNTAVVGGDIVDAVGKLKEEQGPDMAILGSGSIVSQLTSAGLIDEYQIVIAPIVLGKGRTMFEGITSPRGMRLKQTRAFENGKVVLYYEPITVAELMN